MAHAKMPRSCHAPLRYCYDIRHFDFRHASMLLPLIIDITIFAAIDSGARSARYATLCCLFVARWRAAHVYALICGARIIDRHDVTPCCFTLMSLRHA